jgi:capsular exopolysaccharide synthesis family protein
VEIIDYVRLLRRTWPWIVTCAVLAVGTAWIATARATPQYAASITMFVAGRGTDGSSAYQAALLSGERVKSYAHLLTSDRLTEAVARRQPGRTPERLRGEISADVVPDTVLLRATVRDPSPARAQAIANDLGARFIRLVDELERPPAGGVPLFKVSIVDSARVPTRPADRGLAANLAIGLLAGLGLGVGAGLLRETLDTSVKTVDRLREITGGPVLGVINTAARRSPLWPIPAPPPAPARDEQAPAPGERARTEAFRFLGTNLLFADADRPVGSVVLTGVRPRDGASSTACGLAVALAQAGRRVVLVDGSMRDPQVAGYLGIDAAIGLTSVLRGQADLDRALRRGHPPTLSVLPGGPATADPGELLAGRRLPALLAELRERADIVIVDAPPLLSVADAAMLARDCDGAVVVTRYGRTTREQLRRAVDQLRAVDARLLGTVLNRAPEGADPGYGHAYSAASAVPRPAPAQP